MVRMKLTKTDVVVLAIVCATPIFAFLDWWMIGWASPMDYLFLCSVESILFGGGYVVGRVSK